MPTSHLRTRPKRRRIPSLRGLVAASTSSIRTILWASIILSGPTHAQPKFEAGGYGTYSFLKEIGTRDAGVGTEVAGLSGRFVYRAFQHVDMESDFAFLPGNAATTGDAVQGLFGAKSGWRGLILRLDLADSIVKYGRRTVHSSDSIPDIQAGGFTTHNLQVSFGVGIRFPK